MALSADDELTLIKLLEQEQLEMVSPKMELARNFGGMIIGARGGRAAGAKSTGFVSLMVQEAHRERHRYACLRETQESLDESVKATVEEQIDFLQYPGWRIRDKNIISPTGSRFIFRGLKDYRSIGSIKGLSKYDRFFIDEAAYISNESIDIVLPTVFRNAGARLMFAYNPITEFDPIAQKIWNIYQDDPDALLIDMRPCEIDNPWFSDELKKLSDKMRATDPDLWEHIYGGRPLSQGDSSVMSRVDIRAAMDRDIQNPQGPIEIGVDVARFGDDKTVIYKRHGLKIIDQKYFRGADTQRVASVVWDMANHDPSILIKVDDTGVGGGVTDRLRVLGAKVDAINFGANPCNNSRYTSVADEMWFECPIKDADIPDDQELMIQLSGRLYDYDKERKKIESKKIFKTRIGCSPDKADALLLCYYNRRYMVDPKIHEEMRQRRGRGK